MSAYRQRPADERKAERLAQWKRFRTAVGVHRITLVAFVLVVMARALFPSFMPRPSILLGLGLVLWTRSRARSLACPICKERILYDFSGLRALVGIFPKQCTVCSAEIGSAAPHSYTKKDTTYIERREIRWSRFKRQFLTFAFGIAALYGIDHTGEKVVVRGNIGRPTAGSITKDTFEGRSETPTAVSRVYTEAGSFDWDASDPGPVLVYVKIGRLTGLPYPISLTRVQ